MICGFNDGWIKENHKEQVICSAEICVADIILLFHTHSLNVNLKMTYLDAKKKGNAIINPNLKLRIRNISSVKSYFSSPPPMYTEGLKMELETYSKNHLKVSFFRVRRILAYMWLINQKMKEIFHFKYPLFSFICFWVRQISLNLILKNKFQTLLRKINVKLNKHELFPKHPSDKICADFEEIFNPIKRFSYLI